MSEDARSIRFGVLCDGFYLPSWQREAVGKLLSLPNVSLALLIQVDTGNFEKNPTDNSFRRQLYRSYLNWLYSSSAKRKVSINDWAANVPLLICQAEKKPDVDCLRDADVNQIEKAQLDFILHFSELPIKGRILKACRFGVWAFQYGSQPHNQDSLLGFWEIFNHELVTAVRLCRLVTSNDIIILRQAFFQTKLYTHSGLANSIYQECAHWPADLIPQILANKIIDFPTQSVAPKYEYPSNRQLLTFLARLIKHKLQYVYKTFLQADQWNIGVVNRPITDFLHPERLKDATIDTPLLPNRNIFYADGFARQEDYGTVIYFEAYDYRSRRGNISRLTYPWSTDSAPSKVLDFPFHLSYPFLFGPYCMPEAWSTHSVRLYDLRQPVTSPTQGILLLAGIPAIDSTLLKHDNRYWLFYTRTDRDAMLNLFISYADLLDGPWHEHPQNPVKSDVRSARPAGPFFKDGGRLYRPAQDCSLSYGSGITVNEVLELTPTTFVERSVTYLTSIHPDFPDGMHTLTAIDETSTLVDFKRHRFIPFATLLALWIWIAPIARNLLKRAK
jgi:hypothetical protein